MSQPNYPLRSAIVNTLTFSRMMLCPLILGLMFLGNPAFKWLILIAFITDALDGFLARRLNVVTKLGSQMDSIADDILFSVCAFSVYWMHVQVITDNLDIIFTVIALHGIKIIWLYAKHKKFISGMHTYLTKAAAFLQALFFIDCMFWGPDTIILWTALITTCIAITEEILIISACKQLKQDMKGIFF